MPSKGSQLWGRPLTVTRQRSPSPGKMALTALASSPMKDGGSSAVTPWSRFQRRVVRGQRPEHEGQGGRPGEPGAGEARGPGPHQEEDEAEDGDEKADRPGGADPLEKDEARGEAPGGAAGDVGGLEEPDLAAARGGVVLHRALQRAEREPHQDGGRAEERERQQAVEPRQGAHVPVRAEVKERLVLPVVEEPPVDRRRRAATPRGERRPRPRRRSAGAGSRGTPRGDARGAPRGGRRRGCRRPRPSR